MKKNNYLILLLVAIIFTLHSCTKTNSDKLSIGQSYQGGIVAYLLVSGDPGYDANVQHGLIAAPTDQSTGLMWWNGSNVSTNTNTGIGTGLSNTNSIIAAQGTGNYAATICRNLTLGGYTDWFLPSQGELNQLYLSKTIIGGFSGSVYWSSSENTMNFANTEEFDISLQNSRATDKKATNSVRAIRAF